MFAFIIIYIRQICVISVYDNISCGVDKYRVISAVDIGLCYINDRRYKDIGGNYRNIAVIVEYRL